MQKTEASFKVHSKQTFCVIQSGTKAGVNDKSRGKQTKQVKPARNCCSKASLYFTIKADLLLHASGSSIRRQTQIPSDRLKPLTINFTIVEACLLTSGTHNS
jgi:hypothetical protein